MISCLRVPALFRWPAILLLVGSFNSSACEPAKPAVEKIAPVYGYEVVHTWAHDSHAFTQGLVFNGGNLIESTGEVGHSSLRRVNSENGTVLQKVDVPPPYFAEGITLLKGKIYQLTWQHQLGFVYDALSFEKLGTFNYQGEGWGLTNDGQIANPQRRQQQNSLSGSGQLPGQENDRGSRWPRAGQRHQRAGIYSGRNLRQHLAR